MLVNHEKTESSNDFLGGTFGGTGSNPSKSASVDEDAGDMVGDVSSISRVNFVAAWVCEKARVFGISKQSQAQG